MSADPHPAEPVPVNTYFVPLPAGFVTEILAPVQLRGDSRVRLAVSLLGAVLCGLAALALGAAFAPVVRGPADPDAAAVHAYRDEFAPDLLGRQAEIDELAQAIDTEPDVADRVERYDAEVLPRAQEMLALVEDYHPATGPISAVHEHAVAAARLSRQAAEETAQAYRAGGDSAQLAHARHLADQETREWRRWLDALLAL